VRRRAVTRTAVPAGPTGTAEVDDRMEMVLRPVARFGRTCALEIERLPDTRAFADGFHDEAPDANVTRTGESVDAVTAAPLLSEGVSITVAATRDAVEPIARVRHGFMTSQ
jgi:hypothetical protein